VGPYIPYDLLQTKGETCAKFSGDRFRNVDLYDVQTNKNEQKAVSSLYIRLHLFYTKIIKLLIFNTLYAICWRLY